MIEPAAPVDVDVEYQPKSGGEYRVTIRVRAPSSRGVSELPGAAFVPSQLAGDGEIRVQFNAEGHQVIAFIAQQDLRARSATVADRLDAILRDGNRTLREAAVFPDVIRNEQPKTAAFHFVDIPLKVGGPKAPALPKAPHLLTQLETVTRRLKSARHSAQSRVDDLSWMIHLVGDVHQPLHCVSRVSKLHPSGDRGGNAFKLKGRKNNLHSLWDSAIDLKGTQAEEQLAESIATEHPRASLAKQLAIVDAEAWARSSFEIARTQAYTLVEDPAEPPTPDSTYLADVQRTGRRQAALAGYRLSQRLIDTLGR